MDQNTIFDLQGFSGVSRRTAQAELLIACARIGFNP